MLTKGKKALKKIFECVESVDQNSNFHPDIEELAYDFNDAEKELDAWSICAERKPDLCQIDSTPNYEDYLRQMNDCEDKSFILEPEEFYLLKEMLK